MSRASSCAPETRTSSVRRSSPARRRHALAALVDRRDPPAAILLVGEEGCGKSAVACKFVEARLAAGGSVLTIDVQALSQQLSTTAVGTHFDLPRAPAESLVLASPDRPAVLVLDV